MPEPIEDHLRRLRRRAQLATYLGVLSRHALAALFLAGIGALLLRVALGWEAMRAAWCLALLALAPFSAWWVARRRFLSTEGAAAWLDLRAGARGLLLTEIEVGDERWRERAEHDLRLIDGDPGLRLRPVALRCVGGGLFALLALWIDIPRPASPGPPPELFAAAIEDLQEKLETLVEVVELEPETRAELESRLERLEQEVADAQNPEATFEALDQLEGRLEEEAERVQEAARAASEALAQASESAGHEDHDGTQEALQEAVSRLDSLGLDSLPTDLGERLAATLDMTAGARFDLSELTQLSQEMREALEGMLGELADAGLLPAGKLGQLGELGELGDLSDFEFHECDEECEKPGGT